MIYIGFSHLSKILILGNSLAVQWLRLHAFTAKDPYLIPGQGTKMPQITWRGLKKIKILTLNVQKINITYSALEKYIEDLFSFLTPRSSISCHFSFQIAFVTCLAQEIFELLTPNLTLTSIHDHRKNHSLDQTDLCWQNNSHRYVQKTF